MDEELYEDDPNWGERVDKMFAEATHEAYLRAREIMPYIVLQRGNQIIKLYKDDSFEVLHQLEPRTQIPKGTIIKIK